jgi:hypothetical protein
MHNSERWILQAERSMSIIRSTGRFFYCFSRKMLSGTGTEKPGRVSMLVQRDGVVDLVLYDEINYRSNWQLANDRLIQSPIGIKLMEEERGHGSTE